MKQFAFTIFGAQATTTIPAYRAAESSTYCVHVGESWDGMFACDDADGEEVWRVAHIDTSFSLMGAGMNEMTRANAEALATLLDAAAAVHLDRADVIVDIDGRVRPTEAAFERAAPLFRALLTYDSEVRAILRPRGRRALQQRFGRGKLQ